MQSSRAALIVAAIAPLAAGCFADHGVAIEVDVGTTGATSVELYVGNAACSNILDTQINCKQGIAPPMISAHLQGTIWFRSDLVPYVAVVKDHKATFRLQADEPTTLPIAIVVGSKGPGSPALGTATLRDVDVPAHAARLLTTTLVAAGEVVPATTRATEDRAEVWTQPDADGSSCVVVEHWADGKATRDFIVPAEDPDCDRVKDECDPFAWHGAIKDQGIDAPPACFVAASDSTTEPCHLGAFGCSDDTGTSTTTCLTTREEVCAPRRFCECRSPSPDDACPRIKLTDLPGTVPHLECTVRIAATGACRNESEPIDLQVHYDNAGCDLAVLSSFPFAGLSPGRGHDFGGTEIEASSVADPCAFTVRVRNGDHPLLGNDDELGMIKLTAHGRAIVLPVVFHFVLAAVCDPAVLKCTLNDVDDPMWDCGQQP